MGLSQPIILPVSALNIGVVAALPWITAQVTDLEASIANLGVAVTDYLPQVLAGLPSLNLGVLEGAITAHIAALPSILIPSTIVQASIADAAPKLTVQLGLVETNFELVTTITGKLTAGVNAGGLSMWTYSGDAGRLGKAVNAGLSGSQQVQGFIVACESFSSWSSFSATFNTGLTSNQAPVTGTAVLTPLGSFTGGELNTGVLQAKLPLDLYLAHLTGLKSSLEGRLKFTAGLNLPQVGPLVVKATAILPKLAAVLDKLLKFKFDPTVRINGIQARINALLKLTGDLEASLSAGGLVFWSYSGAMNDVGPALIASTANGLPSGSGPGSSCNAVIVMCESPQAFADFSLIFGRAA